ncbi:unnamed protein product, partial [Candidula unifasciata]
VSNLISARAPEVWRPNTWVPGQDQRQVTSHVSSSSSYPSVSQVQGNYSKTGGQHAARTAPQVSGKSYQGSSQNEGQSYNIKTNRKQEKLHAFGPAAEIRPEIGYPDNRYSQPEHYRHAAAVYDELTSPDPLGMRQEDLKSFRGRGGRLFERRKKRSDKFIIDDTTVKALAPSAKLEAMLSQTPRKEITPWQAAEAYGGNVESAFSNLSEWETAQRQPVNRNPPHLTQQRTAFRSTLTRDESPSLAKSANFNRTARGWSVDRETRFDDKLRHISQPRQPFAIETARNEPHSYTQAARQNLKTWQTAQEEPHSYRQDSHKLKTWLTTQEEPDSYSQDYNKKLKTWQTTQEDPDSYRQDFNNKLKTWQTTQEEPDSYRQDFNNKLKTWQTTQEEPDSYRQDFNNKRKPRQTVQDEHDTYRQDFNKLKTRQKVRDEPDSYRQDSHNKLTTWQTVQQESDSYRPDAQNQMKTWETTHDEPDSYREHFNNKMKTWQNITESALADNSAQNWPVRQRDNRENYYSTGRRGQWSRTAREEKAHPSNWPSATHQVPLSRSWHSGSQISPGYGNDIDWSGYYNSPVAYRQPIIPGTDL